MPIIITEPAVDLGFGIVGYFVRNPPPGAASRRRAPLSAAPGPVTAPTVSA
jgi:hypothetical protein